MRSPAFWAVAVCAILPCRGMAGMAEERIGLQPFTIDHRAADGSVVDLSFLLEAPAGKHGFLRVHNGHLARPDGTRIRLWGVNITEVAPGSIHFPPKEDAAFWAETLARFGVNCVRLHFVDLEAPKGIIAAGRDDTREFDAEQLDRLDFFIAELKKRGIYSNLNLNVGRKYKAGDGVRDHALIGYAKALSFFNPRLIELQKEYARKLLTHYNPYTKSEYRHEPAIAIIELVNENSIVTAWARGRLRGLKTSGPAENWQDIPPSYERELTGLYNQWLERRLAPLQVARLRAEAGVAGTAPVPRLDPKEFPAASKERFQTELAFYMEMESGFFRDMRAYLRETLGSRSLLVGTSDWTYGISAYPLVTSTSLLDMTDAHGPWEIRPMVNEPLNSVPVRLSRSALAGKPFMVSEHNHRFPNDYTSEGIPLLAAYGAFQDWDAIFLYTFETKGPFYVPFNGTRADLSHDPVKIPNLAAGALMFLRCDISAARETVERSYSKEQVYESLRMPSREGVYFTPGFPASVALRHGSRIRSLSGAPTQTLSYAVSSPIVSDTNELAWYFTPHAAPAAGMVTVDSPRTQALIGFVSAYGNSVANLSAAVRNRFATIVLTSLDSKPIARSSRMLLSAGSRVANTGMKWNAAGTAAEVWGGPPTLIEPVTGAVVLRNLEKAAAVYSSALDGAGRRVGRPVPARRNAGGWQVALGDTVTTWYEITVKR
ncbi:MAG: hypothetical protein ACE15B_24225 [Bryobacteraceae bacterium]